MSQKFEINKIIKGCLQKDSRSQRLLLDQYADLLYGVCVRYMKDTGLAKDALQESWIKIFKYLEGFNPQKGHFISWIKTITIRECLKKLNANKHQIISIDQSDYLHIETQTPSILEKLNEEQLVALIHELPASYLEVFNLFVIDGYKHQEIAEMLSISVDASKGKLKRAKQMLRIKIVKQNLYKPWVTTG